MIEFHSISLQWRQHRRQNVNKKLPVVPSFVLCTVNRNSTADGMTARSSRKCLCSTPSRLWMPIVNYGASNPVSVHIMSRRQDPLSHIVYYGRGMSHFCPLVRNEIECPCHFRLVTVLFSMLDNSHPSGRFKAAPPPVPLSCLIHATGRRSFVAQRRFSVFVHQVQMTGEGMRIWHCPQCIGSCFIHPILQKLHNSKWHIIDCHIADRPSVTWTGRGEIQEVRTERGSCHSDGDEDSATRRETRRMKRKKLYIR